MHYRKEIAAVLEKVPNPVCLLNVKLKIRIVHNSKQFIEHDTDRVQEDDTADGNGRVNLSHSMHS